MPGSPDVEAARGSATVRPAVVQVRLGAGSVAHARAYRLAGGTLYADAPLAALAPLAVAATRVRWRALQAPDRPTAAPIHRRGLIGGAERAVSLVAAGGRQQLWIDGIGDFAIGADGGALAVLARDPAAGAEDFEAGLLGPPLILALAQQGIWCLHASAARVGGRTLAFLGESGRGKSTLAGFLDAEGGGWQRLADDVLPVTLRPDGLAALPHFPQLKLPPDALYGVDEPAQLPLDALYVIAPQRGQDALTVQPLTRREAMQRLLRNTIAARLFDTRLLARHIAFCAAAAGSISATALSYPHQRAILPEVAALLR